MQHTGGYNDLLDGLADYLTNYLEPIGNIK